MADADETPIRIDVDYFDRKYKEWLVRRGFGDEIGGAFGMKRPKGRRHNRIEPDEL
jgi:hypothetical protein